MAAKIPDAFKDLLNKRAFAHLATLMPDGSPQVTPVWFDFDGAHIRINSAKGRVKDKNMRRDKRVALSIQDPDNAYRYLAIRGEVDRDHREWRRRAYRCLGEKIFGQRPLSVSRARRSAGHL